MEPIIRQPELIKHREITFVALYPVLNQAHRAALLLADVEGIIQAQPATPLLLQVQYDLLQITLRQIEDALRDMGLHMEDHLLPRLKRALYYYMEEIQRENLGCEQGESNCTKRVFVVRYQKINHACRDQRPEHWRRYL